MAREIGAGIAGSPPALPAPLAAELRLLDRRILPRDLEELVVRLCVWKPLKLIEIARLLRRDDVYLQNTVIKRLLEDGRLDFLYRGEPNHPRQAYVAGKPRPQRVPRASRPPLVPAPMVPPTMEMPDIGRND